MSETTKKKYAISTVWLLADQILKIISAIFIGAMVARYLGPEKYGQFNYSFSVVTIFSSLSLLGLSSIFVKETVENKNAVADIVITTICLRTIGSVVMLFTLLVFIFVNQENQQISSYILIIGASMGLLNIFKTIELYFQAKVISKYTAITNIIVLLCIITIKVYLVSNSYSLDYFIATVAIEYFGVSLLLSIFYLHKVDCIKGVFDCELAKKMLKQAWPLMLTAIIISLYMRIDQLMIGNMIGDVAVGQYSVAVRLGEAWYFVPMIIANSLFPAIISARAISENKYIYTLSRVYKSLLLLAFTAGIATYFLADFVVSTLFGLEYLEAAKILSIHIWAGIFVSIGIVTSKCMVVDGLTRYSLPLCLISVLINVALNYVLIPLFGGVGAAVATLVTQMIGGYVTLFIIKDFRLYRNALHDFDSFRDRHKKNSCQL